MSGSSKTFGSQSWRNSLLNYSNGLVKYLSADLTRFSNSGVRLKSAERKSLWLRPADQRGDRQFAWQEPNVNSSAGNRPQHSRGAVLPVADAQLLAGWPSSGEGPRLFLAPFGSGKSVMAAYFTCQLAGKVGAWCNDRDGQGPLPFVPFPVRLREWDSEGSFDAYITSRSQSDFLRRGGTILSPEQIEKLAQEGHLFPVYDGFDEMPGDGAVQRGTVDWMREFTRQFLLTSRPGSEIERQFDDRETFVVCELTNSERRDFLGELLGVDSGEPDHATVEAYESVRPHLDDLLRRPLFLTAWCADYSAHPTAPADTLVKLMNVVLTQVFDTRVFDKRLKLPVSNFGEVVSSRHCLGEVLAAYAEFGFGVVSSLPAIEGRPGWGGWLTGGNTSGWHLLAVRAGLLVPSGATFFAIRSPVTEYLIGSFYAWMLQPKDADPKGSAPPDRLSAFLGKFRRLFWWRDFADVWRYTFDQLWRGPEFQVRVASEVADWVLAFSDRCRDARVTGQTGTGQPHEDRVPFTCYDFVVGRLLPAGSISAEVDAKISERLDRAFDGGMATLARSWAEVSGIRYDLSFLATRRSREFVDRCMKLLYSASDRPHWRNAAESVLPFIAKLGSEDASRLVLERLLPLLKNPDYSEIRLELGDILCACVDQLPVQQAADLMRSDLIPLLSDNAYKGSRIVVAGAVAAATARQADSVLFQILNDVLLPLGKKGKDRLTREIVPFVLGIALKRTSAQTAMALVEQMVMPFMTGTPDPELRSLYLDAIARAADRFGEDRLAVLVEKRLLPLFDDAVFSNVWDWVAWAVGKSVVHLPAEIGRRIVEGHLIPSFGNAAFSGAWLYLAEASKSAMKKLEPAAREDLTKTALLPALTNPAFKPALGWIAVVLGTAVRGANAETAALVRTGLKEILLRSEYSHAWPGAAEALGVALVSLDLASARSGLQHDLVPLLSNTEFKAAWPSVAAGIGHALEKMDKKTAEKTVTDCLLRAFKSNDYAHARREIAEAIAAGSLMLTVDQLAALDAVLGRHGSRLLVTTMTSRCSTLTWFVTPIDESGSIRLFYRTGGRDDPRVTFDPNLEFASKFIVAGLKGDPSALSEEAADRVTTESTVGPAEPEHLFVFRQIGKETWELAFDSPKWLLNTDLKGFKHICRLLERPNERVGGFAFAGDGGSATANSLEKDLTDSCDGVWPAEEARDRIKELIVAKNSKDPGEVKAAEEAIEKIWRQVEDTRRGNGLGSSPRHRNASKAYKAAKKTVEKAIEFIRDNGDNVGNRCKALATHLDDRIEPDNQGLVYRCGAHDPQFWDVTLLEN